ncbi:MAG: glycoside hydrolase family 2 TIM barrel-domain containing protein [Paludibacter sp.]|nr:glycoside hydrolase family 2 TIM barrel-domain containing protein [Paludibacter sp.]
MRYLRLIITLVFTSSFSVLINSQTNKIRLNTNWQFLRGDLGGVWEAVRPIVDGSPESVPVWKNVNLPHCFNATDAVDPDVNYYQGPGWYKTQIKVNNPYPSGHTILHFEGAGQKTDVFVYTIKVGSHIGGYDEWRVDITDAIKEFQKDTKLTDRYAGTIPIEVRCDNSRDLEMMPSDLSDFNIYGGIYRYLNLEYVPALSIEKVNIYPSLDIKKNIGKLDISINLLNYSSALNVKIKIEISDHAKRVVLTKETEISNFTRENKLLSTTIKHPQLWSPGQPNLYTCRITISSESGEQSVIENFGFRNYEFVEGGPFLLNGSRLLIHGTHRHEDHAGVGAAMTESQIREEMLLMKDMGVNFIRLAHYQQSPIVLDLCDSLGIMVWEEIPWCRGGLGGENYKEIGRNMLHNMINQHKNHPSVILWGLGNENDWAGDFPEYNQNDVRKYMTELNIIAHQLDSSRKTAIRRCDFCKDIPDVYSPSIWAGWYRGSFTEYKQVTEKEIQKVSRFFHAEWGGDSHAGRHSENPDKVLKNIQKGGGVDERLGDASLVGGSARVSKDGDWSESYICNLFEWHLKEQETMPKLTGSAFWVFKDFSTPIRPDNPIPYVNQKGVVQRDFTKKESYYVFQSYWTEKPMVHIYGHTWPTRWGEINEQKMVKVYSNCEKAELFLNGKSVGVRKRNSQDFPAAGLRWNVIFKSGINNLKVVAHKGKITVTDEINQYYQTEKWGVPAKLILKKLKQVDDIATIQVQLVDEKGVQCLDAVNQVEFLLEGDGKLVDNQGTVGGSRKVQVCNGMATINIKLNKGKSVAGVKSANMETVFLQL